MVKWLLQIPKIHSSNTVIIKFCLPSTFYTSIELTKIKKKEAANDPLKLQFHAALNVGRFLSIFNELLQ